MNFFSLAILHSIPIFLCILASPRVLNTVSLPTQRRGLRGGAGEHIPNKRQETP